MVWNPILSIRPGSPATFHHFDDALMLLSRMEIPKHSICMDLQRQYARHEPRKYTLAHKILYDVHVTANLIQRQRRLRCRQSVFLQGHRSVQKTGVIIVAVVV